jgi:uncharacterized RDD family membrane protein YckC
MLEAIPGGQVSPDEEIPAPSYQPSLFRDVLGGSKVIPIPTLTPLRVPSEHEPRRAPPRQTGRQPRRPVGAQQSLEFSDPRNVGFAPSNEQIVCDAPVASPVHRLLSAAFDASMIMIAVGLFLAVFVLAGGGLVLNRQTIPLLAGVVVVIALFYRFLWCIAGGDTPGMRFAGLRLVDFDGRAPDRDQRGVRQVASLLSIGSAGLGLVWALVDEENLTWHDHISKTFPTAL